MSTLSDGAVQLPTSHLSVRVAWHDTDWTGRVCASPSTNHSCTVLRNVKENKDPDYEEHEAGKAWRDAIVPPPCVFERAGFMRTRPFEHEREHRYAWKKSGPHAHFAPTMQRMPSYSLEVTPFRWVMRGELQRYTDPWRITVDDDVEQRIFELMDRYDDTWVQAKENQLALLDSFFSALRPRRSLVFLYVKDLPLIEEGEPGARYLIGAGFVEAVDPAVEWEYSGPGPLSSIMWERGVAHSIRPSFSDGFLLPYHQLLSDPALRGEDLQPFVARAPAEHFDEFSYVSELVTHDGAIAALMELARVVDLLPGVAKGPWDRVGNWLADRLSDTWQARGAYPGMGPMLAAAGLERGVALAQKLFEDLPEGSTSPWNELEKAVDERRHGLIGRVAAKSFQRLLGDEDRYRQLRVMSRFALSAAQARELWSALPAREVIDNPYVLYEHRCGDPVAFSAIDRGLWPQDPDAREALAADPVDEPVEEAADDRRVRAGVVEVLRLAEQKGHTTLDEANVRRRLCALQIIPRCDPPDVVFELAAENFSPVMVGRAVASGGGRAWQLAEAAEMTDLIRDDLERRLALGPVDVTWDWAARIDAVLPSMDEQDIVEHEARVEKAHALETIVRSPLSVLLGPAGTGKTSMLEALCQDDGVRAGGVLLLAPTGKAAVQLRVRTRMASENLAQFLLRHGRWDYGSDYHLAEGGARHASSKTVVIDEASMLTERMLAATLQTLSGVERLIFCGDPGQLPPIGAGRPFADLVAHLRARPDGGGALAQLRTGRRQSRTDHDATPDDVAIASLFGTDSEVLGADEALSRALTGGGDGRLKIVCWEEERDLHEKVVELLGADPDLGLTNRTRAAICRSFGAECEDEGFPQFTWGDAGGGAERWQILSPVRARSGGVIGLNQLIRATWRAGDVELAARQNRLAPPMGADQIVFADKVMVLRNGHRREGSIPPPPEWRTVRGSVANGEVGMVVKGAKTKGHTIELSSQPGVQYTFWKNELNGEDDRGEWLELAYAMTIHKSQGSQFRTTVVVIPDPCPLLSPELLYTALTRQQDKVVLLKQGDPARLRDLASRSRSEVARRMTCLFHDLDPLLLPDGETLVDAHHVHRTARGTELVRSKSEVIVADALHDHGLAYRYEAPLRFDDEFPRHPDFTIDRVGRPPVYWEHLGRLDLAGYRADWGARVAWYASHGVLPHDEGGGPAGSLVWSDENVNSAGIDSHAVRGKVREVFEIRE